MLLRVAVSRAHGELRSHDVLAVHELPAINNLLRDGTSLPSWLGDGGVREPLEWEEVVSGCPGDGEMRCSCSEMECFPQPSAFLRSDADGQADHSCTQLPHQQDLKIKSQF